MSADFARAFNDSRAVRILVLALVASVAVAVLATAFSDVTRPRIYIVKDDKEVR